MGHLDRLLADEEAMRGLKKEMGVSERSRMPTSQPVAPVRTALPSKERTWGKELASASHLGVSRRNAPHRIASSIPDEPEKRKE